MSKGNFIMQCENTGNDTNLTLNGFYNVENGFTFWDKDELIMPQTLNNGISRFDNIDDVNKWFETDLDGNKNSAKFKLININTNKIQLEDNMLVKLRNGEICEVINNTLNEKYFLTNYKHNLTRKDGLHQYDVITVYKNIYQRN